MLIKAQYEEFAKFTDFSLLNKELNVDPFRFVYYSQEAMDRAEYSNLVFLPKDMNAPGIFIGQSQFDTSQGPDCGVLRDGQVPILRAHDA